MQVFKGYVLKIRKMSMEKKRAHRVRPDRVIERFDKVETLASMFGKPGIEHQEEEEKKNEQRGDLFAAKIRFHGDWGFVLAKS